MNKLMSEQRQQNNNNSNKLKYKCQTFILAKQSQSNWKLSKLILKRTNNTIGVINLPKKSMWNIYIYIIVINQNKNLYIGLQLFIAQMKKTLYCCGRYGCCTFSVSFFLVALPPPSSAQSSPLEPETVLYDFVWFYSASLTSYFTQYFC